MYIKRTYFKGIVLSCFFISGISGLIYEVVWNRLLGLVFGNTVFATSTVLTAYMAGLALGSFIGGRYADRIKRALSVYAYLEIGIGAYCLIIPFLINIMGDIYIPIQRSLELSFYSFSFIRFLFCFFVLLIPTTLMGATLPIFSRFYIDREDQFGHGVGKIYAINTLGAFLGTILSGFVMIAYLGVRNSINIAFLGNITAAILCLLIDLKTYQSEKETQRRKISKRILSKIISEESSNSTQSLNKKQTPKQKAESLALMIGFGISGYAALVYEVAWTRALVMIIGSSVYAFSIMLATFLLGIGIGSLIFSIIAKRNKINMFWFAVTELAIGIIVIAMLPLFQWFPLYFVSLFDMLVRNHAILEITKFFVCASLMIIPTILLGMLFPMVTQICTKNHNELGHNVGTLYSVNTLGNIGGAFTAGFVLIPNLGIQNTIALAALFNVVVGSVVFLLGKGVRFKYKLVTSPTSIVVVILLIVLMPSWDKMVISSGASAYAPMYAQLKGNERKQSIYGADEKLLYYKEGLNSTITVRQRESGTIVLAVDGKVDASNTGDMYTQLMLAHLPLLLKSNAQNALIIGLGSGVTLGAAAQHELNQIDCVEIEPAVVEAAKFFKNVNRDVLHDPRVKMIVNDARNYLTVTDKRYDVIISEPSNLWLAGIANLFSSDFYKICRKKLNPGGIICQWSHVYYMSSKDLKVVVNTFRSVFPNMSIWFTSTGDILMIGSTDELIIDYLELAKHYNIQGVREDLQRLGIREPLAILSCYLLDEEGVNKFASGASINSDNHPILEFSVPKSIYVDSSDSNRKLLARFRTKEFPKMSSFNEERVTNRASFWYHIGVAYDYKELTDEAKKYYERAINVDPKFTPAYEGLAICLYKEKEVNKAINLLRKAIEIDPYGPDAYYNLAQMYHEQGFLDQARANYESAIKLNPRNNKYKERLARLLKK